MQAVSCKPPMPLESGQAATLRRRFSQADFDRFARLSGDDNPIHVDPRFAARTRFGRTVAHGMLLYSTLCRLLGTQLPGPGTRQIDQEMVFRFPTYTETEILATVTVARIDWDTRSAKILTRIALPDGRLACDGTSRVRLPGPPTEPIVTPDPEPPPLPSEADAMGPLRVGQKAVLKRSFGMADLAEYARLSGDSNPLFSDPDVARACGLSGCIVPGPLLGGLFSCLLGTKLPGRGTNWLKQALAFPAPALVGEEISATVEIIRLRPSKHLVNLRGTCTTADGTTVCRGRSLVLVKDLESAIPFKEGARS
jgi:acyl dehydratase